MQRGEAWAAVAERLAERYPSVLLDRADEAPAPGTVPVAYSMGGRIVLHRALDEPERWRKLVLVGVSAGVPDRAARRAHDEELATWIETRPIEQVVERWEAQPIFATQSEELRANQRPGRLSFEPNELATLLRNHGQGALPPVWDRLGGVDAEVLLLVGELDTAYADAGERMASLLPNARLETIANAGHAPQLETPDAVAHAIADFIRSAG